LKDWVDSTTTEGIGSNRQVLAAALSDDVLNEGLNSETVELGEFHSVVLRTLEHEPPAPKPLEEVSDDIRAALQSERATEQLAELSDKIIEELNAGASPEELAIANDGEYHEPVVVARSSSEVDRALVSTVFTMPKPGDSGAVYESVTTSDGNQAIIIFNGIEDSVEDADSSESAESGDSPPAPPTLSFGPTEFQSLVSTLEQGADIVRNEALLGGESQYPGGGQ